MSEGSASAVHSASFRDPSGFLFTADRVLYRQINRCAQADYARLMDSDLYTQLGGEGLLIPHEEVDQPPCIPETAFKVIRPERVSFISYPYEWCFSQLKDAALATLNIQKTALEFDMTLKDASAYNIQFHQGRPTLIDTLSFETLKPGSPWVAYRQFCQHFLAPLALMSYRDFRLSRLLMSYIDGVPLDLASGLLPRRTHFNLALEVHLHLHAASQARWADKPLDKARLGAKMSRHALLGLIDNLKDCIMSLEWKAGETEWGNYYSATNYTDSAFEAKGDLVADFLRKAAPSSVWDLGANTGLFSRIASSRKIPTVAFDVDPLAVEKAYRQMRRDQETCLLPLVMDLTNPSPAMGWQHSERDSLLQRGPVDLAMALALVHHLAISNNLPFSHLVDFFAEACRWLIIEFVPKSDSQAQRLLTTREDIFNEYDQGHFETAFARCFNLEASAPVKGSERTLYLFQRRTCIIPA